MPALRAQHPTMADGHEYRIRYIAITSRQVFDPFYHASIIRCVPPFINLPLGSTFANPIFVALNALEHMLHNFGALDWTAWNTWRTQAQWVSWITSEAKLAHLQQMQVEGTEGSVVEEFAAFLTVAAHLRRRLGVDFTWKTVGKSSQPSGPSVGGGGTREADGAGGAGGSGGDPAPRGGSGWATKILGESQDPNIAPTPSTAIAAAWRAKNIGSEPPTGTPRRSFWGAIVGRLNKARPAGKEVSGSRGGMVMYS
ncbi:hypothetical protein DFH09DRAFT_1178603 [Mycena vulgaris]|nr:hypothetical protein DFH09DRAFT_1178603 [Mycena vulgaris]